MAPGRLWPSAFASPSTSLRCAGSSAGSLPQGHPARSGTGCGGAAGDRGDRPRAPSPFPAPARQQLCRVLNATHRNSHRSRGCPFPPAVTACHMLYRSSPSWEGCDCSREPPRSAERVPGPAVRPGRSRSGAGGGPGRAGQRPTARHCRLRVTAAFPRAALPALPLSRAAPGCGRVFRDRQEAVRGCCVSARTC